MLHYTLGQEEEGQAAVSVPEDLVIEPLPVAEPVSPTTEFTWWKVGIGVAGLIALPLFFMAALRD